MKKHQLLFFLIGSLIFKIALAAIIPAFGDETYYYIWSLHPQLSYFDHPPMVSWLIYLSHLFLPAGHLLSLRFSFVLTGFLVSLLWIRILRHKRFDDSSIVWALLLFFLNPLLGPGSILATPDAPLVLFWSLSYFCYLKLISSQKILWYSLLGVFLGLGFCSKYHIVLFVMSGVLYLLLSKKLLQLRLTGILTTVFFGAVFSSPVLIWNAQNQWSSFLFQINHGFGESTFEWAWPLGYLIAQLIIVSPVIFFSLFKTNNRDSSDKIFSLTQLVFFFSSSFKGVVEGNWPLTSHLHSITHFVHTRTKKQIVSAALYWLFFYALILLFFQTPYSSAVRKNLVNSAQFDELYPLVEKYQPLYGPSYQAASLLSWKTHKPVPKLNGLSRHDFYDSLSESTPTANTFYVLKYDNSSWPDAYKHYKKIKLQSFDNIEIGLYQFTYE